VKILAGCFDALMPKHLLDVRDTDALLKAMRGETMP
jgi:hypothetical protein